MGCCLATYRKNEDGDYELNEIPSPMESVKSAASEALNDQEVLQWITDWVDRRDRHQNFVIPTTME